ncbi:MAG TPA: hypothetical protein VM659_20040 [Dongiaceae bacterium]|nr:hypothetical protein [Dongiaceae bacterium]
MVQRHPAWLAVSAWLAGAALVSACTTQAPAVLADEAVTIRVAPGAYHAAGKTAAGKAYEGDVAIEPLGHVKAVLWRLNSGEAYKGIGLEAGSVFGVAYGSSKPFGLVVYRVDGGRLDGRWSLAVANGKGVGHEVLQGPAGLDGSYEISAGENPDGTLYKGRVEIKPTGKTYTLRWFTPQPAEIGTGVLVKDVLVVAYGHEPGFGVVAYQRDGDHLHGLWSGALGRDLGSEDLTPQAP